LFPGSGVTHSKRSESRSGYSCYKNAGCEIQLKLFLCSFEDAKKNLIVHSL